MEFNASDLPNIVADIKKLVGKQIEDTKDAEPKWTGHNPDKFKPSVFPEKCIRFLEEHEKHNFWRGTLLTGHIWGIFSENNVGWNPEVTYATDLPTEEELAAAREKVVLKKLEQQGWKVGAKVKEKGCIVEYKIDSIHVWQPEQPLVGVCRAVLAFTKKEPFVYARYGPGYEAPLWQLKLIKEPKIVPFDLSLEADKAKLRGAWVKDIDGIESQVVALCPGHGLIRLGYDPVIWISAESLLSRCTFLDGSPCGKESEATSE